MLPQLMLTYEVGPAVIPNFKIFIEPLFAKPDSETMKKTDSSTTEGTVCFLYYS